MSSTPVSGPGRKSPARRDVGYRWRLREIMAEHGMFGATDLMPHLAARGIDLSSSQVWRLVTQTPERLSLHLLAVLCDILNTSPNDLIVTTAQTVIRTTTTQDTAADAAGLRPRACARNGGSDAA